MTKRFACFSAAAFAVACLCSPAHTGAGADDTKFSTLYTFQAPAANTFTSPLGSQPDTLPVLGSDGAIYGMTSVGGQYGNGVIYSLTEDGRFQVAHLQRNECNNWSQL